MEMGYEIWEIQNALHIFSPESLSKVQRMQLQFWGEIYFYPKRNQNKIY